MQPQRIDWHYLVSTTRARVYLLWAVLVPAGFVITYFYQKQSLLVVWALIAVIGLGYMYKVMPMRVGQMRRIWLAWAVPIVLGMTASVGAFYIDSPASTFFIDHLGAYWLVIIGAAHILTSVVDAPSRWYQIVAVVNILMGLGCLFIDSLTAAQYLVAAVISAWSALTLWIFRS